MNSSSGRGKRKRRRTARYQAVPSAQVALENRYLQQAIRNSKLDKVRGDVEVPHAPVFYPTIEDFQGDAMQYIEKIRPVAEKYGIAKIVPPPGWNPVCGIDFNSDKKFETKHQLLHRLQEGISFGDGMEYTSADYQAIASRRAKAWKAAYYPDHDLLFRHQEMAEKASVESKLYTADNIEQNYWDIVETAKEVAVEYGNDIDTHTFGSGFPLSERGRSVYGTANPEKMNLPEPEFGTEEYYKETWWNLNNLPSAPDSVLRHVKAGMNGINVPWLYHGSLFSTFCWHNEDNYLYSINYNHKGAPKQWYGVPGAKEAAEGLEKVFKGYLSIKMREVPDLLHHITTMFSPRLLQNQGVPVFKTLQHEGEFVITFPRAFHGGFSMGPNIGEAVNFATHDWIVHGSDANERYRSFARPAVFSHDRLTFTMANHLEDQKKYATCTLLLEELERVVDEELRLRSRLLATGVRDLSEHFHLKANVLDKLDEESAKYDDRRLCHGCKHVCFFSAVACECSKSKVSCLRHSHYMCRCLANRRYFMFWSSKRELEETLERVRRHCEMLRTQEGKGAIAEDSVSEKIAIENSGLTAGLPKEGDEKRQPKLAPGVEEDMRRHKKDRMSISTEAVTTESLGVLPTGDKMASARIVSATLTEDETTDGSACSGQNNSAALPPDDSATTAVQ